jgi:hypothetical protein
VITILRFHDLATVQVLVGLDGMWLRAQKPLYLCATKASALPSFAQSSIGIPLESYDQNSDTEQTDANGESGQ